MSPWPAATPTTATSPREFQAAAAGAEIVIGLTDQSYGCREYAARDPEGNVLCFGTYRPAPRA